MISVASYTDFVLKFTLAFGLVFEMPVVITLLSMIGVVTPQFLSKNRKYAILINFILAAVLTPTPDIINQALMAGPLCILHGRVDQPDHRLRVAVRVIATAASARIHFKHLGTGYAWHAICGATVERSDSASHLHRCRLGFRA
jgi:sec-independent protein translocase protein TatC